MAAVSGVATPACLAKWHSAAADEVFVSQKSSEEDIMEADALKEETASRSVASEALVASGLGLSGFSLPVFDTDCPLAECIDVECLVPSAESWWVKALKEHTVAIDVGTLARKPPLKLLSGCSGMVSEAKVLEARSLCPLKPQGQMVCLSLCVCVWQYRV